MMDHNWPTDPDEHVWGPWLIKSGMPNAVRYRMCVHPLCTAVETKEVPKA